MERMCVSCADLDGFVAGQQLVLFLESIAADEHGRDVEVGLHAEFFFYQLERRVGLEVALVHGLLGRLFHDAEQRSCPLEGAHGEGWGEQSAYK